jgi:hypothetical protein
VLQTADQCFGRAPWPTRCALSGRSICTNRGTKFVSDSLDGRHTSFEVDRRSRWSIKAGGSTIALPGEVIAVVGDFVEKEGTSWFQINAAWDSDDPVSQRRLFQEIVTVMNLKRIDPFGAEDAAAGHLVVGPGCDYTPYLKLDGSNKLQTITLSMGVLGSDCK